MPRLRAAHCRTGGHDAEQRGPLDAYRGSSFRARAEAAARKFRVERLGVDRGDYGHLLALQAAEAGVNFLLPCVIDAVEARERKGKGIHRERTFGNMLASQALCFNVFAPLAALPGGLGVAHDVLVHFIPDLARVLSIEIEHTPKFELLRDQRGDTGVDCDVLIVAEDEQGRRVVLVIETKFVEESFSTCGHRKKGQCPDDVVVGDDFAGCRYASKNGFAYWERAAETKSLRLPVVSGSGCAFGGPLWQLWVNHTLAHAEARRVGAQRAIFAVLAPADNDALAARANVEAFGRLATDPSTAVFIPLEALLARLLDATGEQTELGHLAARLRERYAVAPLAKPFAASAAVTPGHRKLVDWMSTPSFAELVRVHEAALGSRARVYFRPTDKGLVRIALHPSARGYVGFRQHADDEAYLFRPSDPLPTVEQLQKHFAAFEAWLPSVRRASDEERGVIPWLRRVLGDALRLPELGSDWVFLHQEWRFVSSGTGKKSDVLAVHLSTGQLGIVELKSSDAALREARTQVQEYGQLWLDQAEELAPFFTAVLRAMGAAYGNEAAARATVKQGPAALFVGVAAPGRGVRVQRCT